MNTIQLPLGLASSAGSIAGWRTRETGCARTVFFLPCKLRHRAIKG